MKHCDVPTEYPKAATHQDDAKQKLSDTAVDIQQGVANAGKDNGKNSINDTLGAMRGERLVERGQKFLDSASEAMKESKELLPKYKPISADDHKKLNDLIPLLGDPDFRTREKASLDISKMGVQAVPELVKALGTTPDPEIRQRAERLYRTVLYGGGLPDIERPKTSGGTALDQFKLGAMQLIDSSNDPYKMKEAQKFADDPVKTAKRIEHVEQLLAHVVGGAISLRPEHIQRLRNELKNLKEIGPVCARLELDQAQTQAKSDPSASRSLILSALRHDQRMCSNDDFLDTAARIGIPPGDGDFSKAFKAAGGDVAKYEKIYEQRQQLLRDRQNRQYGADQIPLQMPQENSDRKPLQKP